jgi:hypothetical protein
MRERKRREVEPVLAILDRCLDPANELDRSDDRSFTDQLVRLREFVGAGNLVMEKIGKSERGTVLKWMMSLVNPKR